MSQQSNLRNILQQLSELNSVNENNEEPSDTLAEELANEYRVFLGELGPVSSSSSQAKPAAVSATGNVATKPSGAASTTSSTAPIPTGDEQTDSDTQQELEKTIAQLKPAIGTSVDPKKTAQALSTAAAGGSAAGDAAKDFAPALGQILSKPDLATQFKNLLNKLK